ncbi:MAG TPA: hypothetical protein VLW65_23675 [Bryobacteraceae bacterium]|nr:hypothetical protein [Bryobacteraceae bacterium]
MTRRELLSPAGVKGLDRDARIRLEKDNVKECLAYAAGELGRRRAAHA